MIMTKHFEFADFVDEFKVEFMAHPKVAGHYAPNGVWQPGEKGEPQAKEGIILPLSEDDYRIAENGRYTEMDRKLYVTEPLEMGQQIEYKGQSFTIDRENPYSDYADVYIYYAKGVQK